MWRRALLLRAFGMTGVTGEAEMTVDSAASAPASAAGAPEGGRPSRGPSRAALPPLPQAGADKPRESRTTTGRR